MKARSIRVLVALATFLSMLAAGTASAAPPDQPSPAQQVVDHWTPERVANAIPRDLVVDHRGLGYLRLPGGALQPYGHDVAAAVSPLRASPTPNKPPSDPGGGGGGGSDDTTPPTIHQNTMDPDGSSAIGSAYRFSVNVEDDTGVKSVSFVIRFPSGATQSYSANQGTGTEWYIQFSGFTNGSWAWQVEAKDTAKRGGNVSTSDWVGFTVDTGSGGGDPGGGDTGVVTNADWTAGGTVQTAVGRIYFEMPANRSGRTWNGYVCSGTVVTETDSGQSLILTAAHCVYDDANKAFARNVLFIPNQDATTGSGTDLNCSNDPLGCWAPSHGVVDVEWTNRTFPDNIPWDYAFYVVPNSGAHNGTAASSNSLESAAGTLPIQFSAPTTGDLTAAIGYSYSDDPNLMYCEEGLDSESSYGDWWLGSCDLSGGSSGGPWIQPVDANNGPIISVNSWGYTNSPGMAGPRLDDTSASCVYQAAQGSTGNTEASCP